MFSRIKQTLETCLQKDNRLDNGISTRLPLLNISLAGDPMKRQIYLMTIVALTSLFLSACGGGLTDTDDSDGGGLQGNEIPFPEPVPASGPCQSGDTQRGATTCGVDNVGRLTQSCVDGVWQNTSQCDTQCWGNWRDLELAVMDFTNIGDQALHDQLLGFVEEAAGRLETTLDVRDTNERLRLNRSVCYDIDVPSAWRTQGLANTDFVVFLDNATDNCTTNTLAWATTCDWDANGKPIAMRLNMCPRMLSNPEPVTDVDTLEHEMIHGLAFNPQGYDNFVGCDGRSLGGIEQTTRMVTNPFGESQREITTGRVVMQAREHFGCSAITGVPLEDDGAQGTESAHWEQRLFAHETMAGNQFGPSRLSSVTLALLEDSGWYQPDYSRADALFHGKGQGCAFLTGTSPQEFPFDFCSSVSDNGCLPDATHRGICQIFETSGDVTSPVFQHFGNSTELGPEVSEFFPFRAEPFDLTGTLASVGFHHACTDPRGSTFVNRNIGETWGESSRCFTGVDPNSGARTGLCYESVCRDDHLAVVYEGVEYVCPQEGGSMGIPFQNVELICPQFARICQ
ncbi:Uncharacterised protein [BD1-7 clade bacterium]|uniref:Leishmanolysin-like peptidase n=1 Tax=BD1-7 clade bacterium TaxID=2029982 RepID=A0A5S9PPF3_9GAMM|nr:Uncharacterised protein [BD1-7 clade bacterium]